ncbi:hypothetical protein [Urbifossiella limnaea]|uniref:Uncharacterized protein n=1 Tax=Urbifossiella limnaea TaxID=2528023 RepID=A0A517XT67_9BACT|nr:hypothetical protein [Urbifossiella limnaea]QDU20682.1 hypothetical protein ETAA1_26390 [Urbifossiella limnaea]
MDAPDVLLAALKAALATPGEHRLFRSGKLPGLFPSRTGESAEVALAALKDGLLETVRTEVRGKIITEWVTATPKAAPFVHEHDSPRAALLELKDVLTATRAGVPAWLDEARQEVAQLSARFESHAAALLRRLDDLADRIDAAIRRSELQAPAVSDTLTGVVPWAAWALECLDRRRSVGHGSACPLPELFAAVHGRYPELTLPSFHEGLRRLQDARALRLRPAAEMPEPEHALLADGALMYLAER